MEKNMAQNNEKIAEAVRESLRSYTLETPEEEFDAREVEKLVNILNTLEPPVEKSAEEKEAELERFREYREMYMAEKGLEVIEAAGETANDKNTNLLRKANRENSKESRKTTVSGIRHLHKYILAAAAFFVAVLALWGSIGAVNAEMGGGFFHWLKKDDKGVTVITSPQNLSGDADVDNGVKYYSVEEVPEEYRQYLVDKEEIELLEEYEFQYVNVIEGKELSIVKEMFKVFSEEETIELGVTIYYDEVVIFRETYAGKNLQSENQDLENKEGILLRESPIGRAENTIYFYRDNAKYFVEGTVEVELLERIAEKYMEIVLRRDN